MSVKLSNDTNEDVFFVTCWNCMAEYDLVSATWCSCEGKGPSKVCPYCYRCFCDASESSQQAIWKHAPSLLREQLIQLRQQQKVVKKSAQEQIFDMFDLPRGRYSILVTEDDQGLQRYLEKLLRSYFLVPILASTGEEAMAIVREQRVHLVLLDLMIPGLNGFQVCRFLKEDSSTQSLPIIIMTARDDVIDKVKGFVLGVDDYLTKPFHGTELAIRILNLLRKNYRH